MQSGATPEWFALTDRATRETMERIARSVERVELPLQTKHLPMQAHWFILDSLTLANQANREGMHANALSLTRQCLEAISIVELGLARQSGAAEMLAKWEGDRASPGEVRKWLSENVWPSYGAGLWTETWAVYMGHLAKAIQPYAHYSSRLAQWQIHLIGQSKVGEKGTELIARYAPRAYDPQKATRITLFHAILTYTLGRIWVATSLAGDAEFSGLIRRFGQALGTSRYLDGHETDWDQQFWAMLWSTEGTTMLE